MCSHARVFMWMLRFKLRSSSSQSKHTYSPVTLPAPLSAFNAFSFTCVHASLLFWSFTNPPCIFLSMTLLLVLTLIYLLSIHCAWNSYFVFKWTLENWIHILWKWNNCKNVSFAWSLFPLRLYFLFYFECHLKLSLPSFALLPTPSFFLFLPQGCGCCAVSQSKACLGFYFIWETLCPPQLHFEEYYSIDFRKVQEQVEKESQAGGCGPPNCGMVWGFAGSPSYSGLSSTPGSHLTTHKPEPRQCSHGWRAWELRLSQS